MRWKGSSGMNRFSGCHRFRSLPKGKHCSGPLACGGHRENSGARAPVSAACWSSPGRRRHGNACAGGAPFRARRARAGNVNTARDHFTASIERFRALALPSGIGNALSGMAVLALATGDVGQAERLLDEATSVLQQAGPWFLTWALYVRAVLAVRRGNPDRRSRWCVRA